MKIESLEEALKINELTDLPLKLLMTEKMLKMTPEQYDRIAYACENGDLSLFNQLSESDKEYFRNRFEEWESKHCVCYGDLSKNDSEYWKDDYSINWDEGI